MPSQDSGPWCAAAETELTHTLTFDTQAFALNSISGYAFLVSPDGVYLDNLGQPMLPCRIVRLAVPDGFRATQVEMEIISSEQIPGKYRIYPAQPPQRTGLSPAVGAFIEPDPSTYGSDEAFPPLAAQLLPPCDLAGQAMAVVQVCPFIYTPSASRLEMMTSVRVTLSGAYDYQCGDYLSTVISEWQADEYRQVVRSLVVNPEDVELVAVSGQVKSRLPEAGPYEHVIITRSYLSQPWQPLADWHTRKGVHDTIITTEAIYAAYSGVDNQERIRNFLIDAHDTWGVQYVLLGGEHADVPFANRSYDGDLIPSDAYYADYDDDWTYELYVGRVTANNAQQIGLFIDKLFTYEIDPPQEEYALEVCLLGMDLTLASEPPNYMATPTEYMKIGIDVSYIPNRFSVLPVYDSQTYDHWAAFNLALNNGVNLVNHSDHSSKAVMGTGDLNHGSYFYVWQIDDIANDGRLSNIFSLGCHALEMDYNDCIGEHFVIYHDNRGAVSFTGNTRSGWFYVGDYGGLSCRLDINWWRAIFQQNQYRLGQALAWTKSNSPATSAYNYSQWTLNLLGEPEMPLWTDEILSLNVSHNDTLPVVSSQFTVHVTAALNAPLPAARVCLWKGDEVYERALTNVLGDAAFDVAPASHGQMLITVTHRNYLPYRDSAEVRGNIPPVAAMAYEPASPTRHDTVSVISQATDTDGSIDSCLWTFDGMVEAVGDTARHLFDTYGSHLVGLVVYDNGGFADTTVVSLEVIPRCGDINDDGAGPDITDLIHVVNYMFNSGPPPPIEASADYNSSGSVDIADLVAMVNFMFSGGAALECTYSF
ncbi:MAG: C25 family cysteine peptidase [bacterium]